MEMVWRPSRSLGSASDLFTGILYRGYSPPPDFCFDVKCSVPPMQVYKCNTVFLLKISAPVI